MVKSIIYFLLFFSLLMGISYACKSKAKVIEGQGANEEIGNSTSIDTTTSIDKIFNLQSVIDKAANPIIVLKNKTYTINSTLSITKPIVLKGSGNTIIQMNRVDNNGLLINAENVRIENISFQFKDVNNRIPKNKKFKKSELNKSEYISKGVGFNSAIKIQDSKQITIKRCTFQNWIGDGILVWSSSDINIEANKFYSSYYLIYSADIHIKGKETGISQSIKILNNECTSNNRHGISIGNGGYVRDVLVKGNKVITKIEDRKKYLLRNHGILAYYGTNKTPLNPINSNIVIENNFIEGTRNTGIYVPGGYEIKIINNKLQDIGLHDGVKISGGILVGNNLQEVLIEGNEVANYRGTFSERGAIGTFGTTRGNMGNIQIKNNRIHNCTNGITVDQELANIVVEGNILDNIEKSNLYLRRNINVKEKKGTITIRENIFKSTLNDTIPSIVVDAKNLEQINIQSNRIEGSASALSECFDLNINRTNLDISDNKISKFGAVFKFKRKVNQTDKIIIDNNDLSNIHAVSSRQSKRQLNPSELVENKIKNKQ